MSSYITKNTPGDTSWFTHDRFGMFIHFGLYSLPARHEWIKSIEKITNEDYDSYMNYFNPDMFDAREWARQAKAAGMKYAVMTAKHHDGFVMFDSKYTDYKSTNAPCKKDFIKEYIEAFRAEGLKVGVYYSLLDWHHPDYQIDVFHPMRCEKNAKELNQKRNMETYREYLFNQVRELLTNYGKIDIIWFDFTYTSMKEIEDEFNKFATRDYQDWMPWTTKETWHSEELISMIRKINPDIIINNRTGIAQDFTTPEQTITNEWPKYPGSDELYCWEACHTFSGSWGYYRDEMTWKSPEMLIKLLINTVAVGGNLIMNVGPCSRGYIDKRAESSLTVYADWMKYNSRSIYGCTMSEPEFKAPGGCRFTQSEDGKRLYIHLFEYPCSLLIIPGLAWKIKYAQFLHDGSEIPYTENKLSYIDGGSIVKNDAIGFKISPVKPNVIVPVIEVFLK